MKKIFLFLFMFFLTFGLFSAGKEKVRLAIGYIPHIQFAPLYVGIDKGFYSKEGIDLSIEYGFGIDIYSLLDNEKIDIGLSDSDQLIIAGSKGLKLNAIYQYYQKYPVSIVALEGKIKSPEDFNGKIIGTPEIYGTSFIGMKQFLSKYSLSDRVKIERIGYTQLQSLLADKVDGAVCFINNEPVQLKLSGKKIVQWNVSDFSDLVGASFITGGKQLAKKKEILGKFVKATKEAMEWTVKNQKEAFEISVKYLSGYDENQKAFNTESLKETIKLFGNEKGYGFIDKEKYQKSIEEMAKLKLIDKSFNAENIISGF